MNEKTTVPTLKRICMSIGAIPSSYLETMSYYEMLVWFTKYLTEQVTPAVNNNAEAVKELQNYVENFFDNLDVQEEIDHKLDEMVLDGTLADVINQEIFGEITTELTSLQNQIDLVETNNTLIMGDSYARGTDDQSLETLTSWAEILQDYIEAENDDNEVTILAESGSGFTRAGTANHTFIQLLQSEIDNIPHKDTIKNIIICGGYNDKDSTLADIQTGVTNFVNYCYTQFPKATVYVGCIGYRFDVSADGASIREKIASRVYPAYANNVSSPVLTRSYVYLNGVENILKTLPKSYMYENNPHPTQNGQNTLGQGIYQAWKTGFVKNYSAGNLTLTNTNASAVSATIPTVHTGDSFQVAINSLSVTFSEASATNLPVNTTFVLGNYDVNTFVGGCSNVNNTVVAYASITNYANERYNVVGYLTLNILGQLTFTSWLTEGGASVQINTVKQISIYRTRFIIPELLS